ncbi:MAG: hypothetical protein WCO56_15885, partial [Verrucomicrobiota bacterium]
GRHHENQLATGNHERKGRSRRLFSRSLKVMSGYLPSPKGWIAVLVVVFTLFDIPTRFTGISGRPSLVPVQTWIVVSIALVGCVVACLFAAVRGRRPDQVAGALAGLVTLWMIVMIIRVAFA